MLRSRESISTSRLHPRYCPHGPSILSTLYFSKVNFPGFNARVSSAGVIQTSGSAGLRRAVVISQATRMSSAIPATAPIRLNRLNLAGAIGTSGTLIVCFHQPIGTGSLTKSDSARCYIRLE